LQQA